MFLEMKCLILIARLSNVFSWALKMTSLVIG
jgi:hypothetical protein